jgi:streptogramin lyase
MQVRDGQEWAMQNFVAATFTRQLCAIFFSCLALFSLPATALAQVLYVANYGASGEGDSISKISADGTVTVFAQGSGISTPYGLAMDQAGNLFVANYGNNTISKITPDGVVSLFASGGGLNSLAGLAINSAGELFVGSFSDNTVSKISTTGVVSLYSSGAAIHGPQALTINASGELFIVNSYTSGGDAIVKVATDGSASLFTAPVLSVPAGITFGDDGYLYTANYGDNSVSQINSSGGVSAFVSGSGLNGPNGIIADGLGNLFVANFNDNKILMISSSGVVTDFASGASLDGPTALLYVAAAIPEPATYGAFLGVITLMGVIIYRRRIAC